MYKLSNSIKLKQKKSQNLTVAPTYPAILLLDQTDKELGRFEQSSQKSRCRKLAISPLSNKIVVTLRE